jgi:hypothetical protein
MYSENSYMQNHPQPITFFVFFFFANRRPRNGGSTLRKCLKSRPSRSHWTRGSRSRPMRRRSRTCTARYWISTRYSHWRTIDICSILSFCVPIGIPVRFLERRIAIQSFSKQFKKERKRGSRTNFTRIQAPSRSDTKSDRAPKHPCRFYRPRPGRMSY